MVKNEQGKIAVIAYNSNPRTESLRGVIIRFIPAHGISLAWVEEDDIPALLAIKYKSCNCGGGNYKPKYSIASVNAVSVWKNGRY
jgi:hypothetical protein